MHVEILKSGKINNFSLCIRASSRVYSLKTNIKNRKLGKPGGFNQTLHTTVLETVLFSQGHFLFLQVKKTWGATLTTLQDTTVLEDYDVSQSFTHSPSSESVKSSVSDGYLNKPSLAKRRANQQETELFYFNVRKQLFQRISHSVKEIQQYTKLLPFLL